VFPVVLEDVNVTDPPVQNVNGPLAEIVGTAGKLKTVIVLGVEVELQLPFETETV
jgi:hypothetical protein